jgi:hypothetical protein
MSAAALFAARLLALADRDRTTPCQSSPHRDRWTSDSAEDREAAAYECRFCPLLRECSEAGAELKAEFVWGGSDRTKTPKTNRSKAS